LLMTLECIVHRTNRTADIMQDRPKFRCLSLQTAKNAGVLSEKLSNCLKNLIALLL
jgi:hypothetical protein